MQVPEPLVTIRAYDSPHLAQEDLRVLVEEGFTAYVSGGHLRPGGQSELRVPRSQAEAAIALLPPELPTLDDLTRPSAECRVCGGPLIHVAPPLATYVLVAGALLAMSALVRGEMRTVSLIAMAAVAMAAFVNRVTRRRVCERCGSEWRPLAADEEPEP